MNEINDAYIRQRYGTELPQKNVDALKSAMQKYGDNHWWESKDPLTVARYQVFEDVLMAKFDLFHEGIEKLLGRGVWTHEFGLNVKGIRQEARAAIKKLDAGQSIYLDDKVRVEKEAKGIGSLMDYARKTGKPVIGIVVDKN